MLNPELIKLIVAWKRKTAELNEITKYLYEHTELFEGYYMTDFSEDLYRFFAGKITRCGNDINKLNKILDYKEQQRIRIEELSK